MSLDSLAVAFLLSWHSIKHSGRTHRGPLVFPYVFDSSPHWSFACEFPWLPYFARALGVSMSQVQFVNSCRLHRLLGDLLILGLADSHLSLGRSLDTTARDLQCRSGSADRYGWHHLLRLWCPNVCLDCIFDSYSPGSLCEGQNALSPFLLHWDRREPSRI